MSFAYLWRMLSRIFVGLRLEQVGCRRLDRDLTLQSLIGQAVGWLGAAKKELRGAGFFLRAFRGS